MKPQVIDLFCGAGGLSSGFESAGFEIGGGVDIEEGFKETYEENHDCRFVQGDLAEVTGEEILSNFGLDADQVGGVIGGPPCQGFSLAQANPSPGDERNFLVTHFVKLVYEIDPDWFVMENVPQITSMEDGQVLEYLLSQFENIGYTTAWRVLDASHFGVPQRRKRAFFVGVRGESAPSFPEPTFRDSPEQRTLLDDRESPRTVGDAITDLPSLAPGEEKHEYRSTPTTDYQNIMRSRDSSLTNHRAPNHGDRVVERICQAEPGERIPYDSWSQKRRLTFDQPAPTLLAGPRPTYHFAHPTDDRGLSVRERARLQSFPDSFVFYGPVAKQRQMTGNAVPPLLSTALADSIRTSVELIA